MLSRALILAAVTVVLGCFTAIPADAQNLEAGKSSSQIFSSTCSLCHKSPRGLLKSVGPGSLPGFLRQHYTTSTDMASAMSAYVLSNGAANAPVGGGNLTRQGQEAKTAPKPSAAPESGPERSVQDRAARGRRAHTRDAVRPADGDGLQEGAGAPPEAPSSVETPAEQSPGARQKAKQRAAKGKPAKGEPPKIDARHEAPKEEPPKAEPESAKTEIPKTEIPKTDVPKADVPKADVPKADVPKAADTPKADTSKSGDGAPAVETRSDPVPPVTPAAPKEPEKGGDTAVTASPPKAVEGNPNRPLTIDIGPASAPPPVAAPAGSPIAPTSN